MGNEKKCNGDLSVSDFFDAATTFADLWKNANTNYPNWTWIPCRRMPTGAESNEGFLSLENIYYLKPKEDLVSIKISEEEVAADSATLVQIPNCETHVYDFHIAYSFSYMAPVLYFHGRNFDGPPLDFDDIQKDLPEYSLKLLRESKWTFITLEEHPYLHRPWYTLHPCGTSDWMKLLLGGLPKDELLPVDYLLSWLSVVGQVVGLRIPIGLSVHSADSAPPPGSSSRDSRSEMGAVRGVVLDESALFVDDADGTPCLRPGSAALLRRLRYSNLCVGICYNNDVSDEKAKLIKGLASNHSLDCISVSGLHEEEPLNKILKVCNGTKQMSLYITSRTYEPLLFELNRKGWRIIHVGSGNNIVTDGGFLTINKLEELPFVICSLNKMLLHDKSVLVGYVMKPSREEDFAKRGAFPMYSTQNGLLFVPLTLEIPLIPQIEQVDVLLHKATDEIISIDTSLEFSTGISFSQGMSELKRRMAYMPDCCVIDPLKNIYPLMDRHKIQEVLSQLEGLNIKGHFRLRAPLFLKANKLDTSSLINQFCEAKLSFPVIVKPQVACGVADAHNMALVFGFEDFKDICVPLPAIIQEYVDHGSSLYKIYVLGDKIFHAAKKSMPNASLLSSLLGKSGSSPLIFNSLKSLPVAMEEEPPADFVKSNKYSLDLEIVGRAAESLRKLLGLTFFGFDVIIQEGSGDHVVVDLNYLPSFKEIPDKDAIPAFWDAIKSSYESWKASRTTTS